MAGIADLVERALLAGDDLRDHLALRHRAVGEHRLAREVADRPDVAHRGRAAVVDQHERAVHGQVEPLESKTSRSRTPADRDENFFGFDARFLAVGEFDAERARSKALSHAH